MPLDIFEKIVAKARTDGYDTIGLYNWIEPFLAKTLDNYVCIIKREGLFCDVSSNFSLRPSSYFDAIQKALEAGIDTLRVSVSGYQQEIYAIDHVGGNISWVKENLERVALLKRHTIISTHVIVRFLKFDYNAEEEAALRNFAESLGVDFEVIDGVGHPSNSVDKFAAEHFYIDRLKNFAPSRTYEKNGEICPLVMDTIPIDPRGDIYLCCLHPNYPPMRIGSYLDSQKEDILLQRYTHPICQSCNFPRRLATTSDCDKLVNAIKVRLGHPDEKGGNGPQKHVSTEPESAPPSSNKLHRLYRRIVGPR
jgi:MoaA/NifB/PqqE/SkfB family radical SAM enzyme